MKNKDKKITRREAIEKTGKYAALTAAATFLILHPKKSQADSPGSDPKVPGWSKAAPNQNKKSMKDLDNNGKFA